MAKILFHSADRKFRFPEKKRLKQFLEAIFSSENIILKSVDFIFCSDDYLLEINKTFLQHDFYTDIITFDLSESEDEIIGEIYISLDRVKDNANNQKTSLKEEILRVIFHGVLHLCGYNDKSKAQISLMRTKEDYYIHLFTR